MDRPVFHRLDATVLRVEGEDAQSWLQGQITSDLASLDEGPVYGLILTPKGKIVSDVWVAEHGGDLLAVLPRAGAEATIERLERYLVMEDVELEPLDLVVLHVLGTEPSGLHFATSRLGKAGWDLLLSADSVAQVSAEWDEMHESAWEQARIEAQVPRWSTDFGLDTLPQEAGLHHAISFEKGCYLGQEPIVMLRDRGKPPKRLVAVRLPETDAEEIRAGERVVGRLTSRSGDHGLALIKRKALDAGHLEIGGQPLEVVAIVGQSS